MSLEFCLCALNGFFSMIFTVRSGGIPDENRETDPDAMVIDGVRTFDKIHEGF